MEKSELCLLLCGDVMTGRGIDQILPHPSEPQLYEGYVTDARQYVELSENLNGKIDYPVPMNYIWGDALPIWKQLQPNIKIANLETAITQSSSYWPEKSVHYRMNPKNSAILKTAGIDLCTIANNHILDWGYNGLKETIRVLNENKILYSGAGENIEQAMAPAIYPLTSQKRILVFSACTSSSGVPPNWGASSTHGGVYYLQHINTNLSVTIAKNIAKYRKTGDIVVMSLHWGSNWGYEIDYSFRLFTHSLIDVAKIDIVYCHSSHHPRPIELYKHKPILYGCGDFINDYEGITGYEDYRDDLTLMYFLEFDKINFLLKRMILIPLQIKNFSLHRANKKDCEWMLKLMNEISFNIRFKLQDRSLVYE